MVKRTSRNIVCILFLFLSAEFVAAQEVIIPLNEHWKFRKNGTSDEFLTAVVPGTVHTDLQRNNKISDPFLGTNNLNLGWVDESEWEYSLDFTVSESLLKNNHLELVFEGLDTYADIYVNGGLVSKVDNMFRRWNIDCTELLNVGDNNIIIIFKSALEGVKYKSKSVPYTLPGGEWAWVRKAPYHFGWDWGPRFVTAGIWKPVYIKAWSNLSVDDIQIHNQQVNDSKATLFAKISITADEARQTTFSVACEDKVLSTQRVDLKQGENSIEIPINIDNPKLWWCNGFGEQPLYKFDFMVESKGTKTSKSIKYGIRSVELVQQDDSIGRSFFFKVNGIPVFMKGTNMIPRHSFIPSASKVELRKLIKSAASSGVNMIRIWGGGVYEDDLFYTLCDSLGILVWQDFMFAGSMYPGDEAFLENIRIEATQQVLRLRNHPCIALWCGNNEVDEAWHNWGWQKQYNMSKADSLKIWTDYKNLFQKLIPDIIAEHDSERPYWASSPKNGWGRKQSMTEGDSHYWGVWWGFEPFSVYKSKIPRFMSEYGFQGYPDLKTLKSFSKTCLENPDSLELLAHQKHPVGYQTISKYSEREGLFPKTLEEKVYTSQIVQSIGYRTAIEAHRLAMPRCMGTLYWQLNDCWPVVSWSTIDYYGRWKGVQYTIREAYKPFLLSAVINKSNIDIRGVSDSQENIEGTLNISVFDFSGKLLKSWSNKHLIKSNKSELLASLPYQVNESDTSNTIVFAEFVSQKGDTYSTFTFGSRVGNLKLQNPEIKVRAEKINGEQFLVLTCSKPTLYVNISSEKDVEVDNNFFNMLPDREYIIKILKGNIEDLKIKSLFDYLHK